MGRIGILCPGQGAQFVGMGREWAAQFEKVQRLYESADQILGFSISRLCFEGPEENLTRTLYAQPAIFVTSLAIYSVLQERFDFKPDFAAGLSLGEFTALVIAGALSFADGIRLVKARAELMEKAAGETQGAMASVLGLDQSQCEDLAKESGVQLANLNAPDQFVLSGRVPSIEQAVQRAEAKGAKKVIRLKVAGAFHSALMGQAKEGLKRELEKVKIQKPRCLFVANASASVENEGGRIQLLLGDQLVSPVRWIETMEIARRNGIRQFIELGPGRVLKGLAKRIDSTLEVLASEKPTDLSSLEPLFQKV